MDQYRPVVPQGAVRRDLMRNISQTTDIMALAKMVTEAYSLTVSQERDVIAIKAQHSLAMLQAQNEHEQIMKALDDGFAAQELIVTSVMASANRAIDAGDHELAHAIISQLLQVQANQPGVIEQAYSRHKRP